ncbi:TetR/AcrR family transcriptional regulator [Streptosporangium carneum]|uniref:Transcriptional regulator n=1 Tax=Streptosporangium carneum TaxID=47481 RepID=A0A9W6IA31_9ACTN|nr:TetR/AcrR family transcriptional regulator [Streptosporangium carneum]GLK13670.1 transcriptional regulator [Streptosporangium carneum]
MSDELPALPWERARRRPGPARVPLTRDRIVEAAFAVLDRVGYEKLSMRQVAAELGVAVSALYAHVNGKDELLELMYLQMYEGWQPPVPDPERWQEQVQEYARTGRAKLHEHRDMARVAMTGFPFSPEALPHIDRLLGLFRAGGLPDRIVGAAGDVLSTFVNGFAFEESMWETRRHESNGDTHDQSPEENWQEMRETLERYFSELPPERFPNLVALSGIVLDNTNDDRFDLGVEIIIRGLASFAEDASPAAGPSSAAPLPSGEPGDA